MSIWTDWLDYIPIVGTAKNSVEAVAALCRGDYDLAKQKGGEAALGLVQDLTTGGVGHVAETAAVRTVEKLALKGVAKEATVDAAKLTWRAGVKGWLEHSGLGDIEKLREKSGKGGQKPKGPQDTTEDEQKRSKRGEHVINNNVLKVFKNIIDDFAGRIDKSASELLRPGTIADNDYNSPLPERTTEAIKTRMVVHIPITEHYIDANSTLYGGTIGTLRTMVVQYMVDFYHGRVTSPSPQVCLNINQLVYYLNQYQLYVDEYAKAYWLREGGNEAMFEDGRSQVQSMFERLKPSRDGSEIQMVQQWVRDLTGHLP